MHKQLGILLTAMILLVGCSAQKNIVQQTKPVGGGTRQDLFVLIPDQEGNVGKITITNNAGTVTLSETNESVLVSEGHVPATREILAVQDVQKKFHAALQAIPGTADHYILYFNSGSTELTEQSKKLLPEILSNIRKRLPCEIAVIGHADTEASGEYNLDLSLKRALEVKKELLAIGVPRELLEISSHGENDPMVLTPDNVAEPKNRRVEVFVR